MSIDATQFRELIVRDTLLDLDHVIPYREEAEDLLCMTAAHESLLGTYIKQVGGPALGVYQMEPATHDDIWYNYLLTRPLKEAVLSFCDTYIQEFVEDGKPFSKYPSRGLIANLKYATAMARVHYWRVPEALPRKDSEPFTYLASLAIYAKKYYNTPLGKAAMDDYYQAYIKFFGG